MRSLIRCSLLLSGAAMTGRLSSTACPPMDGNGWARPAGPKRHDADVESRRPRSTRGGHGDASTRRTEAGATLRSWPGGDPRAPLPWFGCPPRVPVKSRSPIHRGQRCPCGRPAASTRCPASRSAGAGTRARCGRRRTVLRGAGGEPAPRGPRPARVPRPRGAGAGDGPAAPDGTGDGRRAAPDGRGARRGRHRQPRDGHLRAGHDPPAPAAPQPGRGARSPSTRSVPCSSRSRAGSARTSRPSSRRSTSSAWPSSSSRRRPVGRPGPNQPLRDRPRHGRGRLHRLAHRPPAPGPWARRRGVRQHGVRPPRCRCSARRWSRAASTTVSSCSARSPSTASSRSSTSPPTRPPVSRWSSRPATSPTTSGGTNALLDALRLAGVDKFVFSSTCAVYGTPTKLPGGRGPFARAREPLRREQAHGRADARLVRHVPRPPVGEPPLLQRGGRVGRRPHRRGLDLHAQPRSAGDEGGPRSHPVRRGVRHRLRHARRHCHPRLRARRGPRRRPPAGARVPRGRRRRPPPSTSVPARAPRSAR